MRVCLAVLLTVMAVAAPLLPLHCAVAPAVASEVAEALAGEGVHHGHGERQHAPQPEDTRNPVDCRIVMQCAAAAPAWPPVHLTTAESAERSAASLDDRPLSYPPSTDPPPPRVMV